MRGKGRRVAVEGALQLEDRYGSPSLDDIVAFSRDFNQELSLVLGEEAAGALEVEVSSPVRPHPSSSSDRLPQLLVRWDWSFSLPPFCGMAASPSCPCGMAASPPFLSDGMAASSSFLSDGIDPPLTTSADGSIESWTQWSWSQGRHPAWLWRASESHKVVKLHFFKSRFARVSIGGPGGTPRSSCTRILYVSADGRKDGAEG